ncbi:hypothetical protein ACROAE_19690 [Shewanella sp. MF05960]|uniref:hypothetical protein n=1 Tax=Shewanella sp. MF05960 TaxID=3434874 RepID=UPI003D790027
MKRVLTLAVSLFVLSACSAMNTNELAKNTSEKSISGSGYESLRGAVINYGYDGFDDFNLTIYNNKIKWLGQKGYFQGVASEVVPQISKVADNIYFFSWSTGNGGDNVVHNYNAMRVNAHLSESRVKEALWQIHGDVYNINSPASVFPHSQLTPVEDIGKILKKNIAEKNLPPFAFSTEISHFPEDIAGRNELTGLAIKYDTPDGVIKIEVDGERTYVSKNNQDRKDVFTAATKIADGIYFISWEKGGDSDHIVVNRNSMTVFDHVSPTGERKEAIYDITYFGAK